MAAVRDLATSQEITVVAVPPDVIQKVGDPAYISETVPAGTYNGQTEAVPTAAVRNFLVTHAGVPEASVYAMTKAMYENLDNLTAAHAAAKQIKLEADAAKAPIPLHPGAEKFYKEKGLLK